MATSDLADAAGRPLSPEYRKIRAESASFLAFCYDPASTVEATLQPIRRFGFDASILFSDILVIPDALGQKVSFEFWRGAETNADRRCQRSRRTP